MRSHAQLRRRSFPARCPPSHLLDVIKKWAPAHPSIHRPVAPVGALSDEPGSIAVARGIDQEESRNRAPQPDPISGITRAGALPCQRQGPNPNLGLMPQTATAGLWRFSL